jgi:glycosyltransferase involved in cell wall biosynthesis
MSQALMACANGDTSVEIACSDLPDTNWHSGWSAPIHALGAGKLGMYGYNPALARWLESEVKSFDVVVISGIWMYHTLAASSAARKAGIPYLIYVHGALDPWFRKYYPAKHLKKTAYWKLVEGRIFQDAARVIFTTEEERLLAQDAFRPYRCREQVVAYGTTRPPAASDEVMEKFRESIPGLSANPYLLYLGRIHEKKGIDLLLKVFEGEPLLATTHLVIAGPGDSSRAMALRELANKSPARERIHWTGPIYSERKWGAIHGADALVLLSHCENFGISIAEALGCGIPVLISNKVNIWREVESSHAGFVENDDLPGAARLLKRWATLPLEEQTAMRAAAPKCFDQHFLIERGAEQLRRVLLDITLGSRNPEVSVKPGSSDALERSRSWHAE